MLTLEQMLFRLVVALALGALLGLERELVGKEAGLRTEMLVAAGSTLFTLAALALPYIVSAQTGNLADVIARNSGFLTMIANIALGIGFLGAGLIIKTGDRPHGITTAALVWTTASIGILVGIGLIEFAFITTALLTAILYVTRRVNIAESRKEEEIGK